MQILFDHSESVAALATALAKAQGELENASKNAQNPHFRNRYADLAEIINTVRPVLSKHGLSVVQMPGYADGLVTVTTMLTHESGEWMRGTAAAPATKADPQGVGSATTYLRRYSLAAMCCIAQEDDDAEAAVGRVERATKAQEKRISELLAAVRDINPEIAEAAAGYVESNRPLTRSVADKVIGKLERAATEADTTNQEEPAAVA